MTNVIRPTFGKLPQPVSAERAETVRKPLRIYGDAAGYVVALIADDDAQNGDAQGGGVLQVAVGPLSGDTLEPVAILPRTPEGEIDAERVGMAVLRALELTE